MEKYPNKRLRFRNRKGRFRKAIMQDFGIGGVCPVCGHFLIHHYDGDPRDEMPDPRNFRYRCFTCEPETEEEKALKAEIAKEKAKTQKTFQQWIEDIIEENE